MFSSVSFANPILSSRHPLVSESLHQLSSPTPGLVLRKPLSAPLDRGQGPDRTSDRQAAQCCSLFRALPSLPAQPSGSIHGAVIYAGISTAAVPRFAAGAENTNSTIYIAMSHDKLRKVHTPAATYEHPKICHSAHCGSGDHPAPQMDATAGVSLLSLSAQCRMVKV